MFLKVGLIIKSIVLSNLKESLVVEKISQEKELKFIKKIRSRDYEYNIIIEKHF